jgi:hypothetical protein
VFDPAQSRIQEVETGSDRSVAVTVDGVILFVPTGSEAKDESAAADVIDGARHVGEQVGVADPDPGNEHADLWSPRDLAPSGQGGPAFEIVDVRLLG